jgi:hypothetical protein
MSEKSVHYGKNPDHFNPVGTRPLTPEQIAEYIHEEHTPYASMSLEEGKKHLAELIQRYTLYYAAQVRLVEVVKPNNSPVNSFEVNGIDFIPE